MSAQHTPGPWRYEADGERLDNDMRHAVLAECNDLWIAACYRSGTTAADEHSAQAEAEAQANARLIATAPDLLSVVKRGRQKLATYTSVYPGDKELRELLEAWDAAIARAKGDAS